MHGRGAEEQALRRLLDGARDGDGGALVLAGEPGMGRTALLGRAAGLAGDGFLVLRVSGVAAESRLPYAGLHALLRPIAADAAALLPEPQFRSLSPVLRPEPSATADGGETAAPGAAQGGGPASPEPAPIPPASGAAQGGGLPLPAAVLALLAAVAAERPVLACVDDMHLLDPASREVLAFTARRVAGERVALVFTTRTGECAPGWAAGLPVVTLRGLDGMAVRELADDLAPGEITDELLAALNQIARGNPSALTELIGSLTRDQLSGVAAPPETLPRNGRLWREHASRLAALPAETVRLLLLVAADPEIDVPALLAAARPRCALAVLEPAERAGILHATGDRYAFRDPALRSVAYHGASLLQRRTAHRRLATLIEPGDDRPGARLRRAWHRAWAMDAAPDELADDLASAARDDRTPGGHPETYQALERAAELTGRHRPEKAERLAAAARHAWVAGRPQVARALLARLHGLATAPNEVRARVRLLRGSLELLGGETGSAREELLAAATWLLESHRVLGVRALVRAADASYRAGDNRQFIAIARQAAALRRPDEPVPAQLMFEYLAGMAATFSGAHREAAAPLRRVVELAGAVDDPSVLVWACVASMLLGEDASAQRRLSARALEAAGARGAASAMPQLLEYSIYPEVWTGRYASVAETAARGLRLAREAGQLNTAAQHLAWLAMTAAVEGDQETCRMRADAAIDLAGAHDLGIAGAIGTWALACLDLAAGRPADAAGRLRAERRTNRHVVIRVMATPHLIEACARTGDHEGAEEALKVLEGWVGSTRSPDLRALVARCRALLAGPGEADELFREALELHAQGGYEFEAARTRLLYGSALRRDRRPGAAREHLHAALETFERHGARLWTEQARTELRASGEPVGPAPAAATARLTAQQLRIARMVAEGATNKEVAEQLFLSPRTVEHHLRNIFTRLGVRSRVELVRLMS